MGHHFHFKLVNVVLQLFDMGYKCQPFIWHRSNIFERLDRAMVDFAWSQAYPHAILHYLPLIPPSNHFPLLLLQAIKVKLIEEGAIGNMRDGGIRQVVITRYYLINGKFFNHLTFIIIDNNKHNIC